MAIQLDTEDFWWTRALMSGQCDFSSPGGWTPPPTSNVGLVLNEFVQSDYAATIFSRVRIDGMDRGAVRGMFNEVRLRGGTLEIKFQQVCENIEGLDDRLAKYLRARLPQLRGIHQVLRDGVNIL